MKEVAAALSLPKEQAPKTLRTRGGTKPWLMTIAMVALVYAPRFIIGSREAAQIDAETRGCVAPFGAPTDQGMVNSRSAYFSGLLRSLKTSGKTHGLKERHPELFVDTPQYDYRLVTEVIWRSNKNMRAGMNELEALRQSIGAIETAKSR